MNKIHYGIGKEYLPNWGLKEALREIYQNFLDYGQYEEEIIDRDQPVVLIRISNAWVPESLDFLRIGNSKKQNPNAIGKHGEGLKMAFLILLREGYGSSIFTNKYVIDSKFHSDPEIGECFCLQYVEHNQPNQKFTIEFECPKTIFEEFHSNIISPTDIIFTYSNYGSIVNKTKGNIYSGGIFVLAAPNMTKSYDISPEHLPLDRDRAAPRSFDLNYASSKINDAHGKWETKDLTYDDTAYVKKIPDEIKKTIKPRIVGNSVAFTFKN